MNFFEVLHTLLVHIGMAILLLLGVGTTPAGETVVVVEESSPQYKIELVEIAPQLTEESVGEEPSPIQPNPKEVLPPAPVPTPPPEQVVVTPPPLPTEPVSPPSAEPVPISFNQINEETRAALVNILCTTKAGGSLRPISGSGITIDPRGVILTNAHVAQYFLLKDYQQKDFVECVIRSGSPARNLYKAELLYIPPVWISEHAADIINPNPTGTGENDYAFLRITGRTDPNASLPNTFSYVAIDSSDVAKVGLPVLLASYPAGFLGSISIQKDLYIVSTVTTIHDVFTFHANTLDLFSTGGSVVAQKGSSGGAAVDELGNLIGLIVTSSTGETTQERDLRAATLAHINRSLVEHSGFDLNFLLFGDLRVKAQIFNLATAPTLTRQLTNVLDNLQD